MHQSYIQSCRQFPTMGYAMLTRYEMKGVYALVPTPFTRSGEFDEGAFRENARRLCEIGVHGIATTGTFGEFHTIPWEDHQRLIRALVDEVSEKVAAIAGCSAVNTDEAIKKVKFAQDCGADAVMNVPPYYVGLTRDECVGYFKDVAHACPDIGIIVYNNPNTAKILVSADMFREISEAPNVCGSKEIVRDFSHLTQIVRASNLAHMHVDSLFVPMMMWGGKGVFSLSPLLTKPKLVMSAYEACLRKDWDRATKLQNEINDFTAFAYEFFQGYNWICATKAIVNAFDFVDAGHTRRPFIEPPESLREKAKKALLEKYGEAWVA